MQIIDNSLKLQEPFVFFAKESESRGLFNEFWINWPLSSRQLPKPLNAAFMNIALVNTYDRLWGSSIACSRLTEALLQAGASPRMVVQEAVGDSPYLDVVANTAWKKKLAKARLGVEKTALYQHDKAKGWNFAFGLGNTGLDISRRASIKQADAIHLHWPNNGFLSLASVAKLAALGKPLVWTMHDMWPFTGGCFYSHDCDHYEQQCGRCPFLKNPRENDLSRRVWKRKKQLNAGARIAYITPSRWLRDLALSSGMLRGADVRAIPNAIDTRVFRPGDKARARARYNLPAGKPLVLFGSAKFTDERKGFAYLHEAIKQLKQSGKLTDLELVVYGKADEHVQFPELPVHYTGMLTTDEQLAACYNACDALALPTMADNLPTTVMEALACGVPAVAFDVGGVPDMIAHKENGWLAAFKSVDSFAEGLAYVAGPDAPRAQLRQNAVAKVEREFSYPAVARQHLDLYNELLNHGK